MRKIAFQHYPLHALVFAAAASFIYFCIVFFSLVWHWQPIWFRCDDASEKLSANNEQKARPELKYK